MSELIVVHGHFSTCRESSNPLAVSRRSKNQFQPKHEGLPEVLFSLDIFNQITKVDNGGSDKNFSHMSQKKLLTR